MGNLGLNKIAGAVLATSLGLIGLHKVSNIVFAEGGDGHHGDDHHEETMSEQMCSKFAYCVEITDSGHGGDVVEEVFDLGLLLASADASKGARVFKGQCSTCHTIESGGASGTGPNLYGIVGAGKAAVAGFGYSAALTEVGGNWSYDDLNAWLENPASYARGTSMSFAGLRKDPDRMNLIAYLAENTADAPAFPAPLPAVEAAPAEAAPADDAHAEDGAADADHGDTVDHAAPEAPALDAVESDVTEDAATAIEGIVEDAQDAVEDVITEEAPAEAPIEAPAETDDH